MGVTTIDITNHGTDLYTWIAVYEDETAVPEFDSSRPDGRGFAEVDASRVRRLLLIGDPGQAVVALPQEATPVFFRRRRIDVNIFTDEQTKPLTVAHCIGWQKGEEGCFLFVFGDGSSLLSSDMHVV